MKTITDILYKDGLGLDLFLPNCRQFPLFVYFHGGGLENGDKASDCDFRRELLDKGIAFASVNYRMYPDAHYPDFIEDAAEAVAYLRRHISGYGDCTGIYVGGSSAGGYLSMMLCFCDSFLNRAGMKPAEIAGWIHDSGQPTKHFRVLKELGIDSRRVIVDETAPLYWVGAGEEQPSPMLFLVSDNDMKNRYEQTMLMLSTLRHFGIGEETASLQILHGKHCAHVNRQDENGTFVFGKIIADFIQSRQ